MLPLVNFKDPVSSCMKSPYHPPGQSGEPFARQSSIKAGAQTVPCPKPELTQSLPSAEGLIQCPPKFMDFNGIWMWSSAKTHAAQVAIKVHSQPDTFKERFDTSACRYECHRSDEREGARKTPGRQNGPMTTPSNFTIRNNVFILCLSQGLNCQQLCHHTLSPLAHFCIQHITRHNNSFSPVSLPVKPSCTLHRNFLPRNWGLNSQVIQQCSLMHALFDISSLR